MGMLTDRQLALLRSGENFGVVATLARDGRPRTSVVWVDTDGKHLLFNTTNRRAKARHLRADPRVSVAVWDLADPYRFFEVVGTATLIDEGANEHIDELSRRYTGEPFDDPSDRVIVRVNATKLVDHGVDG
jgi:PPOX class probable F420-dependent enzyme